MGIFTVTLSKKPAVINIFNEKYKVQEKLGFKIIISRIFFKHELSLNFQRAEETHPHIKKQKKQKIK